MAHDIKKALLKHLAPAVISTKVPVGGGERYIDVLAVEMDRTAAYVFQPKLDRVRLFAQCVDQVWLVHSSQLMPADLPKDVGVMSYVDGRFEIMREAKDTPVFPSSRLLLARSGELKSIVRGLGMKVSGLSYFELKEIALDAPLADFKREYIAAMRARFAETNRR